MYLVSLNEFLSHELVQSSLEKHADRLLCSVKAVLSLISCPRLRVARERGAPDYCSRERVCHPSCHCP